LHGAVLFLKTKKQSSCSKSSSETYFRIEDKQIIFAEFSNLLFFDIISLYCIAINDAAFRSVFSFWKLVLKQINCIIITQQPTRTGKY